MENSGLTHKDRILKALESGYFKVDERTLNDFIEFSSKFAQNISFYNTENDFDGTAVSFFGSDTTLLLINVSTFDMRKLSKNLDLIITNIKEQKGNFNAALKMLYSLLANVDMWKNITSDIPDFNDEITSIIRSKLSQNLSRLISFENTLIKSDFAQMQEKGFFPESTKCWSTKYYTESGFEFETTTRQEREIEAINVLYDYFNSITASFDLIINSSENYLEQKLTGGHTQPHVALFIAFIRIYKQAQNDINNFTQRHLDHFYKEILKFENYTEIADKVHLTFELQDSIDTYQLPNKASLYAGQDSNGKDIVYKTDNELVVTKANIDNIKTIINDSDSAGDPHDLFKHVFLNSKINHHIHEEEKTEDAYSLGFALATSFLKLAEGDREVTFTFQLQRHAFDAFVKQYNSDIQDNIGINVYDIEEFVRDLFSFAYTSENENGEPEVFVIPQKNTQTKFQKNTFGKVINQLDVSIKIPTVFPPITTCDDNDFSEAKEKELPLCYFYLHHDKMMFYNFYKILIIEKIGIKLNVAGIKDLVVQNDYGTLDSSIPFEPFGATPNIGSNFYIGHETIFSQKVDDLQIVLDWKDVPILDNGFAEYYEGYSHIINNQTFKVKLSALKDRKWIPSESKEVVHLFDDVEDLDGQEIMPIENKRVITDIDLNKINSQFKDNPKVNKNDAYSRISTNGFLKLEFAYPPTGFGYNEYPEIIKKQAFQSIKKKSAVEKIINPPWTPTLNSVSINYESSILIDFNKQSRYNKSYFYHVLPFGNSLVSGSVAQGMNILPNYDKGTEVYIAIQNFNTLENLSIFINIDNLASKAKEKATIEWRFLQNNIWVSVYEKSIIEDTTNDLSNSGIITFDFTEYDKEFFTLENLTNNRTLPKGFFYLSLKTNSNDAFINKINYMKCNGVSATFFNDGNTAEHLEKNLPSNTILTFVEEHPDIKEINQRFPSFGGEPKESQRDFEVRVSERLRHKDRGVSLWDYEHLVLQEFKEISKVVCLNHTDERVQLNPGNILLVVIPNIEVTAEQKILEPRCSEIELQKIEDYLLKKISPFVKLEIRNPIYEQVQAKFEIKIREGYNPRHYLHIANEELKEFLNPWIKEDSDLQITAGDNVYGMHIVYFLEKRPYIDYVSNMSVFHIIGGNIANLESASDNNVVLKPKTSISILVSAPEHVISIIGKESVQDSIGTLAVGKDFSAEDVTVKEIIDGIDKNEIEVDFEIERNVVVEISDDDYFFSLDL